MKKTILALVLLVSCGVLRAQVGSDFSINMFASLGGGFANYTADEAGFRQGGYFTLSGGKWITRPLALRLTVDWAQVKSPVQTYLSDNDYTASYFFASAEFLWDPISTFYRPHNCRLNVYPLIGLGLATRSALDTASGAPSAATYRNGSRADNDFQAHIGLQINYRFSRGWALWVEGRWLMTANGFDHKTDFAKQAMYPVMVGITRNFYDHPYHRRTEFETRNWTEDWFIGYNLGVNFSSYEFEHICDLGPHPNVGIFFGRNFSNFWTIRIMGEALWTVQAFNETTGQPGDANMIGSLHADLMLNLTHAIRYTRGVRLNVLPYLGAGPAMRFKDPTFTMAADAGVQFRYYLNHHGDLFFDLRYLMVPPRIGGGYGPGKEGSIFGVGYPSFNAGYIHNFGTSTTRYRMPVNASSL